MVAMEVMAMEVMAMEVMAMGVMAMVVLVATGGLTGDKYVLIDPEMRERQKLTQTKTQRNLFSARRVRI